MSSTPHIPQPLPVSFLFTLLCRLLHLNLNLDLCLSKRFNSKADTKIVHDMQFTKLMGLQVVGVVAHLFLKIFFLKHILIIKWNFESLSLYLFDQETILHRPFSFSLST
jgi:hypothetical protein